MMTRSGSGSSLREETQDGTVCVEMLNFECQILEEPANHGSMRIVKSFLGVGEDGGESKPSSS